MKKTLLAIAGALAMMATPAASADLRMVTKAPPAPVYVSPWDIAFGGALMSDYNFRGISQSDRGPAVFAYFEPRFNVNSWLQLYAGIAGTSVKLATDPSAEIDLYAGIRPTFGPLALDFGFMYYYYPKERSFGGPGAIFPAFPINGNTTLADTDFWEVYAKALWTINPMFAVGANVFYSPDWLNTGADGTYASLTAKVTPPISLAPDWGMFVSAEVGHYWLGTTNRVPLVFVNNAGTGGWQLPDYSYWNIGVAFTYKVFTLDLRYHDTNLSRAECNALTADPGAAGIGGVIINNFTTTGLSKWCSPAFIAKLSFDMTLANLK